MGHQIILVQNKSFLWMFLPRKHHSWENREYSRVFTSWLSGRVTARDSGSTRRNWWTRWKSWARLDSTQTRDWTRSDLAVKGKTHPRRPSQPSIIYYFVEFLNITHSTRWNKICKQDSLIETGRVNWSSGTPKRKGANYQAPEMRIRCSGFREREKAATIIN